MSESSARSAEAMESTPRKPTTIVTPNATPSQSLYTKLMAFVSPSAAASNANGLALPAAAETTTSLENETMLFREDMGEEDDEISFNLGGSVERNGAAGAANLSASKAKSEGNTNTKTVEKTPTKDAQDNTFEVADFDLVTANEASGFSTPGARTPPGKNRTTNSVNVEIQHANEAAKENVPVLDLNRIDVAVMNKFAAVQNAAVAEGEPLAPSSLLSATTPTTSSTSSISSNTIQAAHASQSQETPKASRLNDTIAAFDPLIPIPTDWMMSFESPAPRKVQQAMAAARTNDNAPLIPQTPLPNQQPKAVSLLDTFNVVASPNSVLKYSEKDVQTMKEELQATHQSELAKKEKELQEWKSKCTKAAEQQKQIQAILDEYEKTMANMIDDAQKEREKFDIQASRLNDQNKRLQIQVDAMEVSFKELRVRYEENKAELEKRKMNELSLQDNIQTLKSDVMVAQERYDKVVKHAEQRLDAANTEIARVRSSYEKDLSALKAKLSRSELQIKSLEKSVETKLQENKQLTELCDELVKQLEGSA